MSDSKKEDGEIRRSKRPSEIPNRQKRQELYHRFKIDKAKQRSQHEKKIKQLEKESGQKVDKKIPKTLENTREVDETIVQADDQEVLEDEQCDELANYYHGQPVKTLITTSKKALKEAYVFAKELMTIFPNSEFRDRGNYHVKEMVEFCKNRHYTDIVLVNEDQKMLHSMTLIHLPDGPTAHFRLTNIIRSKEIPGHGRATEDYPELILNHFNTRLGHTVGRMLAALFPHQPKFKARQVVTFHNQRDFVFFRRHRYMFDEHGKQVALQELGPRFTLKLQALQKGTFDTQFGEYEWIHKTCMDTSRRRFFL
jgi:ribosome production factor 1